METIIVVVIAVLYFGINEIRRANYSPEYMLAVYSKTLPAAITEQPRLFKWVEVDKNLYLISPRHPSRFKGWLMRRALNKAQAKYHLAVE